MRFCLETFEPGCGWVVISEHPSIALAIREMQEQSITTKWNLRVNAYSRDGRVFLYKDGTWSD